MGWTPTNPLGAVDRIRKVDFDKLWDNAQYLYNLTNGYSINVWTFMDGQSGRPTFATWYANQTTTDVTAVIQATINTKLPVFIPVGRYLITDTLIFPSIGTIDYAGIIQGSGATEIGDILNGTYKYGTVLVTPADFDKPLFYAHSSRDLIFRDFTVVGPAKGYAGSIAFHFSSLNRWWKLENITIYGWETGIQGSTTGGAPFQGCDSECTYDNIIFRETTYCTRMYNSQSYNWHFYGCTFDTDTDYTCIAENAGGGYYGNRIRIHGGFIGSKIKIFDVRTAYGMVSVEGAHFEADLSDMLTEDAPVIFDAGPDSNDAPIGFTLTGNEFNYGNAKPSTIVPFIRSFGRGPFVMTGNKIIHANPIINIIGPISFSGNYWYWEPLIYRSDSLTTPSKGSLRDEYFLRFNGMAGDSTVHTNPILLSRVNGITEYYDAAAPTTGTWRIGDKIWTTAPSAGTTPGWVCISSGTFSAATDNTGDTDGSTKVITGMADTSDFNVGEFVTVSDGFPWTGPFKIMGKTATTITVDTASDSAENNVTIETPDPIFKAMASLAG